MCTSDSHERLAFVSVFIGIKQTTNAEHTAQNCQSMPEQIKTRASDNLDKHTCKTRRYAYAAHTHTVTDVTKWWQVMLEQKPESGRRNRRKPGLDPICLSAPKVQLESETREEKEHDLSSIQT
jgi:DNA gyrase inhibitor GyrI